MPPEEFPWFLHETRWGYEDTLKPYEVESDSVKEVTPNGEDWIYTVDHTSNLYYHRITVFDEETGEQLTQAVLYNPFE